MNKKIKYIFWTGGYDSTFRLCQLLIRYKNQVQPIYITDKYIDNYKNNRTRRKNHSQELNSQRKIRNLLYSKFPYTKKLLKQTLILDNIKYDRDTEGSMIKLKHNKYVRRERCQYGAMAQITKDLNKNIEVCAEIGGHIHKHLNNKMICSKRNCSYNNYRLQNTRGEPELKLFEKFIFPIIGYNKKDMYEEAIVYKYNHILEHTWSCWYPKNNKPCGRCIMCRERYQKTNKFENFENISNLLDYNKIVIILIIIFILALMATL